MEHSKYLILYPDTFIWKKKGEIIMYNCHYKQLYKVCYNELVEHYCDELLKTENLYVVKLDKKDLANNQLTTWVQDVINYKLGYIEDDKKGILFVSFPPILNLQSDVDRLEKQEGRDIGEYAAKNWNECTIYISGEDKHPQLYKQIPYPVSNNEILDFYKLQRFFHSADCSYLNAINIVGDFFSYPNKKELIDMLYSMPAKKHFFLTESCVKEYVERFKELNLLNFDLNIYYEGKTNISIVHKKLTEKNISFRWIYLLSSEAQLNEIEQLEKMFDKIEICPIYTGENIDFFEKNIYLTKEDIMHPECDKQDIFAHQVMNTNFWGRLSIMPDGKVYSNPNFSPLGDIENNLYDLIVDEMKSRKAWRLTRDDLAPCSECLFRYLCPSPSNYELVIGKANLCHKL